MARCMIQHVHRPSSFDRPNRDERHPRLDVAEENFAGLQLIWHAWLSARSVVVGVPGFGPSVEKYAAPGCSLGELRRWSAADDSRYVG
ncbi:hypothetical protein ACFPRL_25550 [Pseudoclavibacter helvolus]